MRLELSALAKSDYRDILAYTEQKWGERQADLYAAILDKALREVLLNPESGRRMAGMIYSFVRAGKHLVFYRCDGDRLFVIRILHAQMDIDVHLSGEE